MDKPCRLDLVLKATTALQAQAQPRLSRARRARTTTTICPTESSLGLEESLIAESVLSATTAWQPRRIRLRVLRAPTAECQVSRQVPGQPERVHPVKQAGNALRPGLSTRSCAESGSTPIREPLRAQPAPLTGTATKRQRPRRRWTPTPARMATSAL